MDQKSAAVIHTEAVPFTSLGTAHLQFAATPEVMGDEHMSVLRGTLQPGVFVPLHSHADVESFYALEGEIALYRDDGTAAGWFTAKPGDLVVLRDSVKHAWWNKGSSPAVMMLFTTGKLCRWLEQLATPIEPGQPPQPPTPEYMEKFVKLAAENQYWFGTPQENAAIGLPGL